MMILLQVTAGRGPAECGRAVAHMVRHIGREAADCGFAVELAEFTVAPAHPDCLHSAVLSLTAGASRAVQLSAWCGRLVGPHLWICPSPFRSEARRKNWYFGVDILPAVEALCARPQEIKIEAFRASGPGGQHVNKTATAIRATWLPGGISCTASGERSQAMNRQIALARLQLEVERRNNQQEGRSRQQLWDRHDGLERGNPLLVFRGPEFRVTAASRYSVGS